MENLGRICYKNNFLNQVILRLDYVRLLPTAVVLEPKLDEILLRYFPKKGKDQIIRYNIDNIAVDPQGENSSEIQSSVFEGYQKEYFSSDGFNKIVISNQCLIIEIKKYESFEELEKVFREIVVSFHANVQVPVARTGIRYINIFDANKIKPQKKYFSQEIAATLVTKPENDTQPTTVLIRSMHTNEYRVNSMKLNFRYGMYNPEYPNALRNNTFVLDYDCYTDEVIESSDRVFQCITTGHEAIQSLFENSITDSLRMVMGNE